MKRKRNFGARENKMNKNYKYLKCYLIFLITPILYSCNNNDTPVSSPTIYNLDLVQSSQNYFSYTTDANNNSAIKDYSLSFSTSSVIYSLVVTHYVSGYAKVVVNDNEGVIVWSDSNFTNINEFALGLAGSNPTNCTVTYKNFTGIIKFSCEENEGGLQ
jgi:hypothetical protein